MTGTAQRETPNVGIFWLAQTTDGEARLLASGCPLDQAELYGDCLTYGPGHYETWAEWRGDRTVDPALRAIVRSYEYEDWPRGRIFFDRARDLFVLYADRKLMHQNPISFAAGPHRDHKRLPLSEQRDSERASALTHSGGTGILVSFSSRSPDEWH